MSVLDNALQVLFNLVIDIKNACENASPTSTFAAQNIPVSAIGDGDIVAVETINLASGMAKDWFVASRSGDNPAIILNFATNNSNNALNLYRQANINYGQNRVEFSAAYNAGPGSVAANNNACIPYRIWVIKLLGGGMT